MKVKYILAAVCMAFSCMSLAACGGKDGANGKDGVNGVNGVNGENGKDGVTPKLRINETTNEWEVSYDNGTTWSSLGVSAGSESAQSQLQFQRIADQEAYRVVGIGSEEGVDIVIPATYKDLPVTEIAPYAFSGDSDNGSAANRYIRGVIIPDSVVSIGNGAFSGCEALSSVTFGANSQLTTIGSSAFSACAELTSITIPSKVTVLNNSTFQDCKKLASITLPGGLTRIGAFSCKSTALAAITFNGTVEQWNAISKGNDWRGGAPTTIVTCNDGTKEYAGSGGNDAIVEG